MDVRAFGDFPIEVRRPVLLFLDEHGAADSGDVSGAFMLDATRMKERKESSEYSEESETSEHSETKEMKEKERESGHAVPPGGPIRAPLAWKPQGAR
jgi:hypothetical protein